jgi:hypothetical protein
MGETVFKHYSSKKMLAIKTKYGGKLKMKKRKTMLCLGLTAALTIVPLFQNNGASATEYSKPMQPVHKSEIDFTTNQAVSLAVEWNKTFAYVQRGGDFKNGEYKTFKLNGKTYRFLSSSIDSKKELLTLLGKSLEPAAAEQFIKNQGIISYKGKLAQVEADGSSLLNWPKATAQLIKSESKSKVFRLTVPVGDSKTTQSYIVEYKNVEKIGWRISKEPKLDTSYLMNNALALDLATKYAKAESYIQNGGAYREGEYKTFSHNGKTYRYLSGDIDTKNELLTYLKQSMTPALAEQLFNDRGIIEYNGKLAQLEADGGSTAQWAKSKVELIKTEKDTKFYRLTVPFGESGEQHMYTIEYQLIDKSGWRVSKAPYWDLNIPGNVNPAYIFFNYLLVDAKVAKNQFLGSSNFNVDEFKKGIKKVELKKMIEVNRSDNQVEFLVKINVQLEPGYKGPLVNGENTMYFYIQPTGYMEFKIDRIGTVSWY